MKTIRYVINPDGSIILDFNGFKGQACVQEFQKIVEALKDAGITVGELRQEKKQEYYSEEAVLQ